LQRVRTAFGAQVPLVQLLEEGADVSRPALAAIAGYANAIGPAISLTWPDRGLVRAAHELGLLVHPFTFRADGLPPDFTSFSGLVSAFVDGLGVDGLFTDFPDLVVQQLGRRT
jgi:glycerophosphoryl diester phosphodiesterase